MSLLAKDSVVEASAVSSERHAAFAWEVREVTVLFGRIQDKPPREGWLADKTVLAGSRLDLDRVRINLRIALQSILDFGLDTVGTDRRFQGDFV